MCRSGRVGRVATGLATLGIVVLMASPATAGQSLGVSFAPDKDCQADTTIYPFSGSSPDLYTVQSAGILTSWKFTNGTDRLAGFRFKIGHNGTTANSVVTLAEDRADLAKSSAVSHPVRIAVQPGDRIGFYLPGTSSDFPYCRGTAPSGSTAGYLLAASDQVPNTSKTYASQAGYRIPLSAQVEPDADHDQFGDETQDLCPTSAAIQAPCPAVGGGSGGSGPAADRTKPTLGPLGLSSTTFRAAGSGASISAKKKPAPKVGTKVSFTLSEASKLVFTVQRRTTGRRVRGKCVSKKRSNAKKPFCPRYVKVRGSFAFAGRQGRNTFKFRGRVGRRTLMPGSYRLYGTATDPAKNASAPKRTGFKIVE